jgi:hypothetical protein
MSMLKNLVLAAFAFNLALLVVNNIYVGPDNVRMNTGQLGGSSAFYSFNDTLEALTSTEALMTNSLTSINKSTYLCPPTLFGFHVPFVPDWCYTIPPGDLDSVSKLALLADNFIIIWLGLVTQIIVLIVNSTIGWPFLFITLFSLIDPALGLILGGALGALTAFLVIWGLTEFIPTVSNKEA